MSGDRASLTIRVVWLHAGRSACLDGIVERSNATGVALTLQEGAVAPWEPRARVMLVRGEGRKLSSAPAAFVLARDGTAIFTLLKPWKAFDPRGAPRFPLQVATRIQFGDDEFQRGTVLDISAGGLSVEVSEPVRAKQVRVPLWLGGYAATLRCEVVGTSGGPGARILHLRFHDLEPAQAAFIRNIVKAIADQAEVIALRQDAA